MDYTYTFLAFDRQIKHEVESIKIGRSNSPSIRRGGIATGNHNFVIPYSEVLDNGKMESEAKHLLKEFRMEGEWYRPTGEVWNYIHSFPNMIFADTEDLKSSPFRYSLRTLTKYRGINKFVTKITQGRLVMVFPRGLVSYSSHIKLCERKDTLTPNRYEYYQPKGVKCYINTYGPGVGNIAYTFFFSEEKPNKSWLYDKYHNKRVILFRSGVNRREYYDFVEVLISEEMGPYLDDPKFFSLVKQPSGKWYGYWYHNREKNRSYHSREYIERLYLDKKANSIAEALINLVEGGNL